MFRLALVLCLFMSSVGFAEAELDPRILLELAKAKRLRESQPGLPPVVPPMPVVPAKLYNASHNCPTCGSYQNVVVREENGEHSHTCTHAGTVHAGKPATEWWHADPPTAPLITLPASGCANGQCPAPSAPTRWRLFR